MNELKSIRQALSQLADPQRAAGSQRFFKTGKGEYAEGDRFIGVTVPQVRQVVKRFKDANLQTIQDLLKSPIHEERLCALLLMVHQFKQGSADLRTRLHQIYLSHTAYINNWDLVDTSAPCLVGDYLGNAAKPTLTRLAQSESLWERRIAIIATFYPIMNGQSDLTFSIAKLLLNDPHDLIHKAVGWMLREVGKRVSEPLERQFLDTHAATMPRTMLRYAIERFDADTRRHYLSLGSVKKSPVKVLRSDHLQAVKTVRVLRQKPASLSVMAPRDLDKSILTIFEEILSGYPEQDLFQLVKQLVQLSIQSDFRSAASSSSDSSRRSSAKKRKGSELADRDGIQRIQKKLDAIHADSFETLVDLTHLYLYIYRLSHHAFDGSGSASATPIKDAMAELLSHCSVSEALDVLPLQFTDVLTAHPVDTDRGLITEHKRKLEEWYRSWHHKKTEYTALSDERSKQTLRSELDTLNQNIRNLLHVLLNTPNYRDVRIKPESEQRHLSRAIKATETTITSAWSKIVTFVQESLFEAMIRELKQSHPKHHKSLDTLLSTPRSWDRLDHFSNAALLQNHPCFNTVIQLPQTMSYALHAWRGDMDGNPFVTSDSIAKSIAYGRTRCFESLSADDAVIRYGSDSVAFQAIEARMSATLSTLRATGHYAWKTYIQDRTLSQWRPAQIYSGLAYYRLVEMKEAAEQYIRHGGTLSQLTKGFASSDDFLAFSAALQDVEECMGIVNGTWTRLRQLVKLRGLDLGVPHARKGEAFHLDLLAQCLPILRPELMAQHPKSFLKHSATQQKKILRHFLSQPVQRPYDFESRLSPSTREWVVAYMTLSQISPGALFIQSDSGSETGDIELSILLVQSVCHVVGHTGKVVVLCEDESSMRSAIALMTSSKRKSDLFDGVIMMAAGSDNQKKLGPFYSAYLNYRFLNCAREHGICSFFGIGDSPLRSSPHQPLVDMKTFQPGSRKRFFFGQMPYFYLSELVASGIRAVAYDRHMSAAQKKQSERIASVFGDAVYQAYDQAIQRAKVLQKNIQNIAEIATTYFSRPSKKYAQQTSLYSIRAIDSGRAQLILNTFDPQIAGLQQGISSAMRILKKDGITSAQIRRFFTGTPLGQGILETLRYYADHLDDDIPVVAGIRSVSSADVLHCYETLSGQKPTLQRDPLLRLTRLIWQRADALNRKGPSDRDFRAKVILLFGANWMV